MQYVFLEWDSADAGAVGEPVGLALDSREDGRDGVDAVPGGVEAGDGFAFRGLRTAWSLLHGWRVEEGVGDLQEGDGTNLGGGRSSSFLRFLGLGYHDDSRISHHVAGTYCKYQRAFCPRFRVE